MSPKWERKGPQFWSFRSRNWHEIDLPVPVMGTGSVQTFPIFLQVRAFFGDRLLVISAAGVVSGGFLNKEVFALLPLSEQFPPILVVSMR